MSHTHDRTLLASLGFADPDKGDRRHTLACQYLSDPGRLLKVLEVLHPDRLPGVPTLTDEEHDRAVGRQAATLAGEWISGPTRICGLKVEEAGACEVPIHRKHGFLVGFWDVVVLFSRLLWWPQRRDVPARPAVPSLFSGAERPAVEASVERRAETHWTRSRAYIEVKIAPCDPATIARQIATYRGDRMYDSESEVTIAAVTWAMHPEDKAMLKRNRIDVIRLGKPFEDWCEARKSAQGVPDVEF